MHRKTIPDYVFLIMFNNRIMFEKRWNYVGGQIDINIKDKIQKTQILKCKICEK